jgi:hypothetical protein
VFCTEGSQIMLNGSLAEEISKRRTFAIISHPANFDADKPRQHATKK